MADLYPLFLIVHIFSLVLLGGVTAVALVAPAPERRRHALMASGVLALVVFITGFGLLGIRQLPFQGWVAVKLVCWLVLAMATPMAFRQPERMVALAVLSAGAVLVGIAMVIVMPF